MTNRKRSAQKVCRQNVLPVDAYIPSIQSATIGRNAAVAQIGGRLFTGFVAWLIWLAVHIVFLIGFRNRLGVLLNWAWNYIFYERAVRLILPQVSRKSDNRL